jgi:hypothetical protein
VKKVLAVFHFYHVVPPEFIIFSSSYDVFAGQTFPESTIFNRQTGCYPLIMALAGHHHS